MRFLLESASHVCFVVILWVACFPLRIESWASTKRNNNVLVLPKLPPHAGYHGATAQRGQPFFEGWYLRLVTPAENNNNFAFIYHVFDPHLEDSKRRGVGLQVLLPSHDNDDSSTTMAVAVESPDLQRFCAQSNDLNVRNLFRGGSQFHLTRQRATGILVDNNASSCVIQFDFDVRPVVGWGGGAADRQYATAGFLAAFPIFEPHYQVLMSKGLATGSIVVQQSDGGRRGDNNATTTTRRYDFTDATIYLEKNWGASFPSAWWWIQANTGFDKDDDDAKKDIDLCITSTGALRQLPLTQQTEPVGFVGLHYNGAFLPFSTCHWDNQWGEWNVHGSYEDYTVQLTGTCPREDGFPVRCPTDTGMREIAKETFQGTLRVQLRKAGALILDTTTNQACLEVGGLPWKAHRWKGASEIAEPYRAIVLNQKLERFGADVLSVLNKVVPIPGL